ncbi:MAG: hypothetical protein M3Q69_12525 [Acidobacteriota bacterium]|nr:hypothetical protein [Acidobacteriota bacterium]
MKRAALFLAALAACRTATPVAQTPAAAPAPAAPQQTQTATPPASAEELVDHAGDSTQTAISVPADVTDGGELFENQWIFSRYGRFRRLGGGTGSAEGRRYNVVKIELANGEKKTVYFDITEYWSRQQ